MKFLRMRPGYGEQLIAEGDVEVSEDEQRLIAEFRRQLEQGMWAAIPVQTESGRREAELVRAFEDIPRAADRVIFFPRARELLRSCVNDEEWEMYRDLGMIRVWGSQSVDKECRGVTYAYLIYPHK